MDLRPTSNAAAAAKIKQPCGLCSGGPLAALLLGHRALWLCFLVAPCQSAARAKAQPFRVQEMGSRQGSAELLNLVWPVSRRVRGG